jgi:hypothetical protein
LRAATLSLGERLDAERKRAAIDLSKFGAVERVGEGFEVFDFIILFGIVRPDDGQVAQVELVPEQVCISIVRSDVDEYACMTIIAPPLPNKYSSAALQQRCMHEGGR